MQQEIKRIDTAHYGPMIERSLAEYEGFNTAVKKSAKTRESPTSHGRGLD